MKLTNDQKIKAFTALVLNNACEEEKEFVVTGLECIIDSLKTLESKFRGQVVKVTYHYDIKVMNKKENN